MFFHIVSSHPIYLYLSTILLVFFSKISVVLVQMYYLSHFLVVFGLSNFFSTNTILFHTYLPYVNLKNPIFIWDRLLLFLHHHVLRSIYFLIYTTMLLFGLEVFWFLDQFRLPQKYRHGRHSSHFGVRHSLWR